MSAKVSSQLDTYLTQVKYQNRTRVRDDVLLLAANMSSMKPEVLSLIHNDGCESRLVALTGTLPIYYQGQQVTLSIPADGYITSENSTLTDRYLESTQYNIPVDLFIPEEYPNECPKAYVRPTATMIVHPNHQNVDREGLVFLPYLNQWNPTTSNLLELIGIMSSVFSVEPPLFTKPRDPVAAVLQQTSPRPVPSTSSANPVAAAVSSSSYVYGSSSAAAATAQRQPPAQPASAAYLYAMGQAAGNGISTGVGGANTNISRSNAGTPVFGSSTAQPATYTGAVYGSQPPRRTSEPTVSAAAAVAATTQMATASLYTTPTVSGRNNGINTTAAATTVPGVVVAATTPAAAQGRANTGTLNRKERLVAEVTELLQNKLREYYARLRDEIDDELEVQANLEQSKADVATNLEQLLTTKTRLEMAVMEIEDKSNGLTEWGTEMELKGSVDPDELLQPFDNLSKQIVNLHSRQLAIEDAMYYLERALASSKNNSIDTATFLREIRSLAREQFLCKSHMMKINATIDQKLATGGGV